MRGAEAEAEGCRGHLLARGRHLAAQIVELGVQARMVPLQGLGAPLGLLLLRQSLGCLHLGAPLGLGCLLASCLHLAT